MSQSSSKSEPVELTLVHFHTTDRTVLVGDTGERDKAVWLAISLIEWDDGENAKLEWETVDGERTGRAYPIRTFLVPEWLANERGLL